MRPEEEFSFLRPENEIQVNLAIRVGYVTDKSLIVTTENWYFRPKFV